MRWKDQVETNIPTFSNFETDFEIKKIIPDKKMSLYHKIMVSKLGSYLFVSFTMLIVILAIQTFPYNNWDVIIERLFTWKMILSFIVFCFGFSFMISFLLCEVYVNKFETKVQNDTDFSKLYNFVTAKTESVNIVSFEEGFKSSYLEFPLHTRHVNVNHHFKDSQSHTFKWKYNGVVFESITQQYAEMGRRSTPITSYIGGQFIKRRPRSLDALVFKSEAFKNYENVLIESNKQLGTFDVSTFDEFRNDIVKLGNKDFDQMFRCFGPQEKIKALFNDATMDKFVKLIERTNDIAIEFKKDIMIIYFDVANKWLVPKVDYTNKGKIDENEFVSSTYENALQFLNVLSYYSSIEQFQVK